MQLSKAFMVTLCCLGVAGCADLASRKQIAAPSVPAPAARPDQFAAPPPPPPIAASSISVAPGEMYNLGGSKKKKNASKTSTAKATPQKPKSEIAVVTTEPPGSDAGPAVASSIEANVSSDPLAAPVRKSSGQSAAGRAQEPPPADSAWSGFESLSKDASNGGEESTYKEGAAPQSAFPVRKSDKVSSSRKPAKASDTEVVPVGSSRSEKKLDPLYSS